MYCVFCREQNSTVTVHFHTITCTYRHYWLYVNVFHLVRHRHCGANFLHNVTYHTTVTVWVVTLHRMPIYFVGRLEWQMLRVKGTLLITK